MTQEQLEETLVLGDFSKYLLGHDSFNRLHELYSQQAFTEMMTTGPLDAAQREAIYSKIRGQQDFLGLMKGYVDQATAIRAQDEQPNHSVDLDEPI
jgi:hypothetical protein